MTLTFTPKGDLPYRVVGAQRKTVTDVSMDTSYLSGGEPVTAGNLGLNTVDTATATIQTAATTTVNAASASYDEAAALLHVWDETPAEVASTANLSGLVVRVVAHGK